METYFNFESLSFANVAPRHAISYDLSGMLALQVMIDRPLGNRHFLFSSVCTGSLIRGTTELETVPLYIRHWRWTE